MKKALLIATSILMIISLVACSNENGKVEGTTEIYYADKDFIKTLGQGLEARWSVKEPEEWEWGSDEHKQYYTEIVNKEQEAICDYVDKKFEDSKLQEKAIKYINMVKQQKEALDYLQVNSDKYDKLWNEAYDERAKLIVDFTNNYGLTVSEEYADDLKDMTTNAQEVEKKEETEKLVQDMMSSVKFKKDKEESSDSYFEYTAIVENTANIDFEYFMIDINLLDKDGVILESTSDSVENWKRGQKAKFRFSTGEKFEEYTIDQVQWSELEE